MSALNVLIAAKHQILRDGLQRILEEESDLTIQGSFETIEELFHNSLSDGDVLILDVDMLGFDADQEIEKLREKNPEIHILVISQKEKSAKIKSIMELGVSGFMFKERSAEELKKALHEISKGDRYICDDALHLLLKNTGQVEYQTAVSELTEREVQILGLICKEMTNKEIARALRETASLIELFVSVRTVDAHRRNILQKTGAKNTAGLVKYAIRHHIYEF